MMDRFLAAQTAYNTSSKAVALGCLKNCSTKSLVNTRLFCLLFCLLFFTKNSSIFSFLKLR